MAGIIIGTQHSMGNFSGTPGSEPSQPHRNTATAAPSAAPIEKTSRMAASSAALGCEIGEPQHERGSDDGRDDDRQAAVSPASPAGPVERAGPGAARGHPPSRGGA